MASKKRLRKQKSPEPSVSEQIIHGNPWIPGHVVDDIIQKLPTRSLVRFKCVCKPWNSTISEFHKKKQMIFLSSIKSLCVMNYEASTGEATKHYEQLGDDEYLRVWNSCNGHLLISKRPRAGTEYEDLLWNPLTGEQKLLTLRRSSFDFKLGLGYDYYNNDYKIAIFDNVSGKPRSQVYSFRKDSLRILNDIPRGRLFRINHKAGMLENNSELYWDATYTGNPLLIEEGSCSISCHKDNPVDSNITHSVIFGFNLVQESPMLLHYPPAHARVDNSLMDYKGSLCVIQTEQGTENIQMWVLKGDMPRVSWVKLMSIPRLDEAVAMMSLNDDEALMVYGEKLHRCCCGFYVKKMRLYSYNLTKNAYRKVEVDGFKNWAQVVCFNGSIDSLPKSGKMD